MMDMPVLGDQGCGQSWWPCLAECQYQLCRILASHGLETVMGANQCPCGEDRACSWCCLCSGRGEEAIPASCPVGAAMDSTTSQVRLLLFSGPLVSRPVYSDGVRKTTGPPALTHGSVSGTFSQHDLISSKHSVTGCILGTAGPPSPS